MYVIGVFFILNTLKLGLYSPLTVEVGSGSNSAVNWCIERPIYLAGTIGLLSLFICLVAIGGIGVGNNYKGIKLTT